MKQNETTGRITSFPSLLERAGMNGCFSQNAGIKASLQPAEAAIPRASSPGACPAMQLKDLVSPRFVQGYSGDIVTQEITLVQSGHFSLKAAWGSGLEPRLEYGRGSWRLLPTITFASQQLLHMNRLCRPYPGPEAQPGI